MTSSRASGDGVSWSGAGVGGLLGGRNGLVAMGGLGQFILSPFSCCGADGFMVVVGGVAGKGLRFAVVVLCATAGPRATPGRQRLGASIRLELSSRPWARRVRRDAEFGGIRLHHTAGDPHAGRLQPRHAPFGRASRTPQCGAWESIMTSRRRKQFMREAYLRQAQRERVQREAEEQPAQPREEYLALLRSMDELKCKPPDPLPPASMSKNADRLPLFW